MPSETANNGNGQAFSLSHDAWGRLVLIGAEGVRHVGVEPVRAFPISSPRHGVSLCDAEGRELVWVDDLDGLPPDVRRVLEEELARREFVPVLRRITAISTAVEP